MATKFIQAQEANIVTGIGTSETQVVVANFKTISGDNITQAMIGGASDYVPVTLSPRTPREEQVLAKVASADGDNITLDIQRAVNPVTPYDVGGGIAQPHNVTDTVVISNNPALLDKLTAKDNNETVAGNWTFDGNNTHNGTETFTDTVDTTNASLEIAEATETNQPYTKGQTDTLLDDKADDDEVVKLTSNQTVEGVKTFVSSPVVPSASGATDAVNKGQMETYIAANSGNEKATDTIFGQVKLDVPADDPAEPVVIGANSPINEAGRSVDPADDKGRLVGLEDDGRFHPDFIPTKALDVQQFTANGTWTKPSEGTHAIIEIWGAGGSGGARADTSQNAYHCGGGGGGAYRQFKVSLVDLNAAETVVVGVGGAARSTTGSQSGASGGSTSFKSVSVNGGGGGQVATGTVTAFGGSGGEEETFGEEGGNGGSASITSGGNGAGKLFGGAGGGSARITNASSSPNVSNRDGGTSVFFTTSGGAGAASTTANVTAGNGGLASGGGGAVCPGGTAVSGAGGNGFCRVTVF